MRKLSAALIAACASLGLGFAIMEGVAPLAAASASHGDTDKQAPTKKPGRSGADDSCRWANDNECDEPEIGTGACRQNTDYSDCRYLREGEADACQWANDGECDEPGFGTGACVQGADHTDCGDVARLRFQNDSCATAFNGVCDEPGRGNGSCERRTDRRDCVGAERPMTITDHYFGHDDRVFMDETQAPWRSVGRLNLDTGEMCTATLIARDVIVTAAHCIHTQNGVNAQGEFVAASGLEGGPYEARVTAYYVDRRFDYRRFTGTDEIDGLDWALLRLDQPLGDRLGFVGVTNLTGRGQAVARQSPLFQAGFAWDTEGHLSGHLACRLVTVNGDNTFAHECDTTRGDSGSALMIRDGVNYSVIGVDSNFRSNPNGPFIYIAVSAAGFERHVADFVAGRIGTRVGSGTSSKPKG